MKVIGKDKTTHQYFSYIETCHEYPGQIKDANKNICQVVIF